ncbi:MAG: TonB-dependent receptor [Opitutaceae bacterium]
MTPPLPTRLRARFSSTLSLLVPQLAHRCAGLTAFVFGLLVSTTPLCAQPAAARVEGRVMNSDTRTYLNNARVLVEGTRLETLTNSDGEYRLANVPAGEVRLKVVYAGMEPQSATITVTPGGVGRRDFELALTEGRVIKEKDVMALDTFVVESTAMSAAAAAINEQKTSPNIKNVVVLDEIGDLGDGNIGEYLKYTPGISIISGPQTAVSASIRGMPASGVIFMVDGAEVSSPSADRSFDLAASSSGSVDRIEITKVPTPDRPANAVGGTVNIVGKSGFSNPRRVLKINTYAAYNTDDGIRAPGLNDRVGSDRYSRERAIQPGLDISYSHPVNKSFAFTINASSMLRVYDMDYDSPTWDMIRGVQTTSTIQNVLQTTERQLAATSLDWRISPDSAFRLSVEHVQINTPTRQNVYAAAFGAGNSGGATFTQGAAAGNDTVRQTTTWGDRTRGTTSAVLRFTHNGKLYKIDAAANFSRSWDDRKDLEHGFFRTIGTTQATSLIVRADRLDGIYDRLAPIVTAKTRTGAVFDPYDNAELTLNAPTSQPNEIISDARQVTFNISRDFNLRVPVTLKTGFSINRQRKDNTSELKTWTFTPPGGAAARLVKNYDLTNVELSQQSFFNDTLKVKWVSPVKLYDLFLANPSWFVLNEAGAYTSGVTNSRFLQETITAGYVRGDVKFLDNKLWFVGGFRYEKTDDFGEGPLDDIRATYRQDASGNLLRNPATGLLIPVSTNALETAKLRYTLRGATSRKSYDGLYPSINSTYYLTDTIVLRAAYARTMGRPNLSEIIPGLTITDPDAAAASRTITAVNTGLKPWTSDGLDVSIETYGIKGAVASVSLFRKDIKNFFGTVRSVATPELLADFGLSDDYLSYDVITKSNFGEARVEGYELSWRQSLYFLPSWAKGLQMFGNATISQVSGENALDFTPFAHKNLNWGTSYIRKKVSIKFNVSYAYKVTGARVAPSATVPEGTFSYVAPQITQDLSFDYRFHKRLTLYGSARNLTGGPKRTLRSGPNTPVFTQPQSIQNFGTLVTLGVRSEF